MINILLFVANSFKHVDMRKQTLIASKFGLIFSYFGLIFGRIFGRINWSHKVYVLAELKYWNWNRQLADNLRMRYDDIHSK